MDLAKVCVSGQVRVRAAKILMTEQCRCGSGLVCERCCGGLVLGDKVYGMAVGVFPPEVWDAMGRMGLRHLAVKQRVWRLGRLGRQMWYRRCCQCRGSVEGSVFCPRCPDGSWVELCGDGLYEMLLDEPEGCVEWCPAMGCRRSGRAKVLRQRGADPVLEALDPDSSSDAEYYWSSESDDGCQEVTGGCRVETGVGRLPWDGAGAHEPAGAEDCFSVPEIVFDGRVDWESARNCVWSWTWTRSYWDPGFDYWTEEHEDRPDRVGSLRMWALQPWRSWDGWMPWDYLSRRRADPRPFDYEVDPRPTWDGVTTGEAIGGKRSRDPRNAWIGNWLCQRCLVAFPAGGHCGQCGQRSPDIRGRRSGPPAIGLSLDGCVGNGAEELFGKEVGGCTATMVKLGADLECEQSFNELHTTVRSGVAKGPIDLKYHEPLGDVAHDPRPEENPASVGLVDEHCGLACCFREATDPADEYCGLTRYFSFGEGWPRLYFGDPDCEDRDHRDAEYILDELAGDDGLDCL